MLLPKFDEQDDDNATDNLSENVLNEDKDERNNLDPHHLTDDDNPDDSQPNS